MSGSHDSSPSDRLRPPQRLLMTADAVGGVWRYAIDLSRTLADRGMSVTLAVMGPAPSDAQRAEAAAAGVALRERAFALEWMDNAWADVERAGRWLLALERSLQPDLVHLNGYTHAALPWRAPVVVVAHSCVRSWWRAVKQDAAPESYALYTSAVHAGLRAAAAVVSPSAAMREVLTREYGALVRPALVIRNGIHAPSGGPPWCVKERLVATAGRLWDAAKNIDAVCAAAAALSWPVHVAGDWRGPDGSGPPLRNVHLLGRLPPRDMARLYARASIYALPARYEPFGLSVLEAAAAGCALVLGDIDSLRENWADAAVFVHPDDHEQLAGAVQSLIDRPAVRLRLAARARQRAAGFTAVRMAEEYLRLYESLAA